jgi:hypothetical protein
MKIKHILRKVLMMNQELMNNQNKDHHILLNNLKLLRSYLITLSKINQKKLELQKCYVSFL